VIRQRCFTFHATAHTRPTKSHTTAAAAYTRSVPPHVVICFMPAARHTTPPGFCCSLELLCPCCLRQLVYFTARCNCSALAARVSCSCPLRRGAASCGEPRRVSSASYSHPPARPEGPILVGQWSSSHQCRHRKVTPNQHITPASPSFALTLGVSQPAVCENVRNVGQVGVG